MTASFWHDAFFCAREGVFPQSKEQALADEKSSFKSKFVPYSLYFLILISAGVHEWISGRDSQAASWLKFAEKNKQVLVTNVIVSSDSLESSKSLLAVEVLGMANSEKRAIIGEFGRIVKLAFTPKVGEKLSLTITNGQVIFSRAGGGIEPE